MKQKKIRWGQTKLKGIKKAEIDGPENKQQRRSTEPELGSLQKTNKSDKSLRN